jgi:hypothetical protein
VICDVYDNNWTTHPHKTYCFQVYNGMVLNFLYAPKNNTRFEFYSINATHYLWWMFKTGRGAHIGQCLVNLCNGPATCALSITPRPVVNIDFYGVCPNRPNLQVRPSFWMFFKKTADPYYQLLGYVNNGRITTPFLEVGQTYDFGAWYGGVFVSVTRTITTANYVESVQLSQGICDFF